MTGHALGARAAHYGGGVRQHRDLARCFQDRSRVLAQDPVRTQAGVHAIGERIGFGNARRYVIQRAANH